MAPQYTQNLRFKCFNLIEWTVLSCLQTSRNLNLHLTVRDIGHRLHPYYPFIKHWRLLKNMIKTINWTEQHCAESLDNKNNLAQWSATNCEICTCKKLHLKWSTWRSRFVLEEKTSYTGNNTWNWTFLFYRKTRLCRCANKTSSFRSQKHYYQAWN